MRTLILCALSALLSASVIAWCQDPKTGDILEVPSKLNITRHNPVLMMAYCDQLSPEAIQQIREATKP